tara:strand:+ start:1965 stop:9182 length:7218 start_codon:yes stop_codon:yes gene_type:complete
MPLYLNADNRAKSSRPSYFVEEDDRFEFTKGFSAGIDQTQALGGGLLALAGSAFGNDDLFYQGLDYYNEQMAEAAESRADVGRLEDIDGFDDFLSYVSYTAGNAIPSLATAVAGGGLGGIAAKTALKKGIQSKAQEYAKSVVTNRANSSFRKRVADDYTAAALAKSGRIGAGAGAYLTSAGMGAGESFTRILEEEGEEAPGVALITGIASGGLDAIAPMRALKRIFPGRQYQSVAADMAAGAAPKSKMYSRALREMGKVAGVEGITEGLQEIVQNVALEYVQNNHSDLIGAFGEALTDESKYSGYLNAMAAGVIGGGMFGGVSGVITKDPVEQKSRVSREEIAGENFDALVGDVADELQAEDSPLPQEEDDLDPDLEERQLAALGQRPKAPVFRPQQRAKDRAPDAQDGSSLRDRLASEVYGPLFDQIEARQKAKEILEKEEAAANQPAPGEADPVTEAEVAPEAQTPLESIVGRDVTYFDAQGILVEKDDGFYVVTENEDVFVESGESQSAEALGIEVIDDPVVFENELDFDYPTSKLTLRGREYTYLRTNANEQGETVSVQVVDENGNQRTIRTPEVVNRIERIKSESEFEPQLVDLEDLPGVIQEELADESEANGQPIPDEVPVESALEKAMQLEGYEREIALSQIDEAILQTITLKKKALEIQRPHQTPDYRTKNDPPVDRSKELSGYSLMEAINRAINDNNNTRTTVFQGTDDEFVKPNITFSRIANLKGARISTPSVTTKSFNFGYSPDSNAKKLSLALIDLLSMGMPQSWLDSVDGFGHFSSGKENNLNMAGFFGPMGSDPSSEGYIGIKTSFLRNRTAQTGQLRHTLAHEIAHSADHRFNISNRLPGFTVGSAELNDDGDLLINAGEIVAELYDLYTGGTAFGLEFSYPFAYLNEAFTKTPPGEDGVVTNAEFLRAEIFAQAFATFIYSPAKLKAEAPLTYRAMLGLLRDPEVSALNAPAEITDGQDQSEEVEDGDSGRILPQIRAPASPGGDAGLGLPRSREESQGSVEAEQAGEGVVRAIPDNDGDADGPVVRGRPSEDRDNLIYVDSVQPIARVDELPVASQKVTASGILYRDEAPLEVDGKSTIRKIAEAFDQRVAEAYPDKDLTERTEENAELISDMIAHEALQALNEEGNAGQWYQEKVANALSLAAQRFPEIETDSNAKFAFTAIMAITSNGASVAENSANTFRLYDEYRQTNQFPDFGVGKEAQAMKGAFSLLNRLISVQGVDSVREFMDKDVTVKTLEDTFGLTVSGELTGTTLKGSAILGPKIGGGFYQNLNGNYDPLTMDRWFMRTWGRLTGSLLGEARRKLPIQLEKFRDVALSDDYRNKLRRDGIKRVQLRKDDEYALQYAIQIQRAYAAGGFKQKNALNKASNTLKNSQDEKQAPQNGTEREYIRDVMGRALAKVNRYESNNPINMGALQAIIWYPEKELYKVHGVGNAKSEPTDYEAEFRKIIEGDEAGPRISGPVRLALEPGPGPVQQGTGESERDSNQSRGPEALEADRRDEVDLRDQDATDSDPLEVAENLNAQIREENKPILDRVKTAFRRYLAPGGLLPRSVFDEKIKRDSEMGAVEIDIKQILSEYDRAVSDVYNRDLDEAEQRSLQEALTTRFSEIDDLGLDPDIKNAIIGMRRYLDNMSVEYSSVVFEQAQKLLSQGKTEAAVAKVDLLNTIARNIGSYANRSYQAFDDPKWANKVPDEVLNNAREYLENRGTPNVEMVLNEILKEGTAYDNMEAFIRESKLGAKDLSILKHRKDIAPEIRALLGEYVDPKVNFTKSATKMSRLLFNDRFLKRVKEIGMGTFLFDREDAPADAYVTFASETSDVMAPLNGLKTTPEIEQAFRDALGKEQMEDWYRAIVQANGAIKYGKTVIAPTTLARNYLSAYMFTLANGHFNAGKLSKSFAAMESYFTGGGGEIAYLRRLKELGVVYDTPYAGEMMALLDDAKQDLFFDDKLKGAKWFFDNATKLYQFGDDLWKIVGFENEIDILMDAKGITREEAEPIAARRIRDTYPTYSLVGRGVQKLRRFPLVGTFVSFPAEIIRTSFNMLKYLKQDMSDPDLAPTVPRRIAGLGMVSAGVYALQSALMNMMDVDEDEEEAVRLLGPKWSENSNLAFIGREDGKLRYVDMSAFDPYNYWKRPINALLRDQPIDDAVTQSAVEALKPFFGADIAFQNIMEVFQNEKMTGGSVFNAEDSALEQTEAITYHLIKGLGPSVLSNIERTVKAVDGDRSASGRVYKLEDEMAALGGLRVSTLDPKVSLHFRAYDFNQSKRDATRILTSVFRDVNDVSDRELRDAFRRASDARREAFERMLKIVSAARDAGLNNLQIVQILRSNGVSKKDSQALASGGVGEWSMSDSTLKNSVTKADLLFGDATGREYERRWQVVQGLLQEENQQ